VVGNFVNSSCANNGRKSASRFSRAGRVQWQGEQLPQNLPFEGAGDALIDRGGGWLWAGYGFRSELDAPPLLAQILGVDVLSLRLIDDRFYHLDTCFLPA
jgi:N-dimethylarginine dimethylaminohydrolase